MLDHFLFGRVQRLSPEAPVPIVEYDHDDYRPGGAANVAMNLAALGAAVSLVGVVGDDEAAGRLRERLAGWRCRRVRSGDRWRPPHDPETPHRHPAATTGGARRLRVRCRHRGRRSRAQVEAAIAHTRPESDIVLVSDYLKGCITAATMSAVLAAATPRGIGVLVDPKIPHLDLYRGVMLVTPNQTEAETATHARIRNDDEARDGARRLRERLGCTSVVITRASRACGCSMAATTPATEANFASRALEVVRRDGRRRYRDQHASRSPSPRTPRSWKPRSSRPSPLVSR